MVDRPQSLSSSFVTADKPTMMALMFFMSLAYLLLGVDIGLVIASTLAKPKSVEITVSPVKPLEPAMSHCGEREPVEL